MKKCLLLFLFFLLAQTGLGQFNQNMVDSLQNALQKDLPVNNRFDILAQLAVLTMYSDSAQSDAYGLSLIRLAEETRDRRYMAVAQYQNGVRHLPFASQNHYAQKAESYFNKALEIAQNNKLDKQSAIIYLGLSELKRRMYQTEQALGYCNQAVALNMYLKNDTLEIDLQSELGNVYLQRGEKVLALRAYLNAVSKAEVMKLDQGIIKCNKQLSEFYGEVKDYDKAIDYASKNLKGYALADNPNSMYNRLVNHFTIGNLYVKKKEESMAMDHFEKALQLSDSLGFAPIKLIVSQGILSAYTESDDPQRAITYLNNNQPLLDFYKSFGVESSVDLIYGMTYSRMHQYDSARYYLDNAASGVLQGTVPAMVYFYYYERGVLEKNTKAYTQSIQHFLQAKETAEQLNDIDLIKTVCDHLDTLYRLTGDYQQALHYAGLGMKFKDSLHVLSKEKDLLQAEVAAEQERKERLLQEEADMKKQRHNIQYRIIIISIISLFIALIMFGIFRVSAGFIRMVAFFAFLMVFEFIFLLVKKQGHSITEGEPWKDLLLMIVLAAILLPFHHWLEHKVIHWLTSHNRLRLSRTNIVDRLFGGEKEVN